MKKPVIKASYNILGIINSLKDILLEDEELTLEDISDTSKLALIHILRVGGDHIAKNWERFGSFKIETETTIYDIALLTEDLDMSDFMDESEQIYKIKGRGFKFE